MVACLGPVPFANRLLPIFVDSGGLLVALVVDVVVVRDSCVAL